MHIYKSNLNVQLNLGLSCLFIHSHTGPVNISMFPKILWCSPSSASLNDAGHLFKRDRSGSSPPTVCAYYFILFFISAV